MARELAGHYRSGSRGWSRTGGRSSGTEIEALFEIEVDAARPYWEETREGKSEQVELFYLLGDGGIYESSCWPMSPGDKEPARAHFTDACRS